MSPRRAFCCTATVAAVAWLVPPSSQAADYEVGPGRAHQSVDGVPWESLLSTSPCLDAGAGLHPDAAPEHRVTRQYVPHQRTEARPQRGALDVGAFQFGE